MCARHSLALGLTRSLHAPLLVSPDAAVPTIFSTLALDAPLLFPEHDPYSMSCVSMLNLLHTPANLQSCRDTPSSAASSKSYTSPEAHGGPPGLLWPRAGQGDVSPCQILRLSVSGLRREALGLGSIGSWLWLVFIESQLPKGPVEVSYTTIYRIGERQPEVSARYSKSVSSRSAALV